MTMMSGFNQFSLLNRFNTLGQQSAVLMNEAANPTPGLDADYFRDEVLSSSAPTLTAARVHREGAETKRAMTEFDRMRQLGRREVAGRFSSMRNDLQRGIAGRGMGRSGFAAEAMSKLGAQEGGALAEVEANRTAAIADYNKQLEEIRMQRSAMRRAKKKARKKKAIGTALGIAGLALAPFTGGASLLLSGYGANMAGSA
jgi:hypothetical protein